MQSVRNRIGGKAISHVCAAIAIAIGAQQSAWAAYYAWSGGGSSPFYFDDTANWGFKTAGSGMWIAVPAIGSRSENLNINPTLLVNDGKGSGTKVDFEGNKVPGVAYDVNWNQSFPSTWDKTIAFRNVTSLTGPIVLDAANEPIALVATSAGNGISSTGQLQVKSGSSLQIESGTYSFSNDIVVGGTLTVTNATLKNTARYIHIGDGGDGTVMIGPGGTYENFGNLGSLTVAHASGKSGTLDIGGGTVAIAGSLSLCYNASSVSASVTVTDGGVLTVKSLVQANAGTSGGTVTLDGGTLKAYANNGAFLPAFSDPAKFHVYVGANGATIDSGGHNITIGASLEDKSGEAGVVTFTGGGVITLNGTPSYTGGTTNVAGTVLSLTAAAKTALVAYPVAVEIPSSGVVDGTTVFEINDGNGTFTQTEVDAIAVTGTDASRYALVLADGGAKIVITDTLAGEYVWNGGSSGDSWRTNGNWSKNGTPGNWYDSTAAVFANAGDAATLDSNVTAASVTFRANATVAAGGGTLTPGTVAVSNGVSATVNAPTAGTLVKEGPGTLVLGASSTAQTDITEGTLVMSGDGTTIPWDNVVLGTEPGKTAVLKIESGATLADSPWNLSIGNDGSIVGGVTAELYKGGGDWNVRNMFTVGWNSGDVGKFYHNGGTTTVAGQFRVSSQAGSSGEFTMNGGTVTVGTNLYVGCNLNVVKGVFNMNGGTFICNGMTYVPFSQNDYPAELHINGGTFTAAGTFIAGSGANAEAVINLNSTDGTPGVLETKGLTLGSGSATLTFNGGELKAVGDLESSGLIKSGIAVRVGANGGIVNANGKAVTIPAVIGAAGDTGGMTYKGGGTVTLSAQSAYSGTTAVEVGTTLVVPSAIAGANLSFAIPEGLSTGFYKVVAISGGGTFASDVLSSATLPSDVNARFFLDNGDTEIWCIYSSNASDHIWIGGSTGSLNDGANWLSGSVPTSGTAVIGNVSAATLTNPEGSAFAATTIIVPSGSAAVTISGAKFSSMSKITNNSSSTIEFANVVEFSDNVDVVQNTGAVKFIGGATGTWLARTTDIHGTYNFTGSGDRTEHGGTKVKNDGVYNLPNATFYKHNGDFHMDAGGRAVVKAAKISSKDTDKKLLGTFNGEFKVNGEFLVSGTTATWDTMPTHYTCNSGSGTFIANKIRVNQTACIVPCSKTIMGSEGIIRGSGYVRVVNSGSHEFGSYADWTMYHNNLGNTTTDGYIIFKRSSSGSWSTVTFDTTDYYDSTTGRTITCEAPICAADTASAAKFGVTVKGIGRFVFANTSDGTIFSGGLTVNDSATVEVKPNSWPGKGAVTLNGTSTLLMHTGGSARTGAVTVNSGATLAVAESGTVMLGGNLTLNDGATLKFNFTEKDNAPKLDLTGKTVSFGDQKQITVAISGDRPRGGKIALTSGGQFAWMVDENQVTATVAKADDCPKWVKGVGVDGDGNLYADIIWKGLTIIVH